jgi:hypothetical protein
VHDDCKQPDIPYFIYEGTWEGRGVNYSGQALVSIAIEQSTPRALHSTEIAVKIVHIRCKSTEKVATLLFKVSRLLDTIMLQLNAHTSSKYWKIHRKTQLVRMY